MKVKYKANKHDFDWKAFLVWSLLIALILWLVFK